MDSWRDELGMQDRLSQRVIIVCVNNMNKWMNVKRGLPPYQHTMQMLSRSHPSMAPELLNRFLEVGNSIRSYRVTCLSMVVLAKVENVMGIYQGTSGMKRLMIFVTVPREYFAKSCSISSLNCLRLIGMSSTHALGHFLSNTA
ncbi:hypothetical protein Scep_010911 [Stephania cephalantha]|uniref:Uncharacterized protein n=1 Tax=Stephania cephalantha TaxID=152367 RepID=A0AAP0JX18_9MAGN